MSKDPMLAKHFYDEIWQKKGRFEDTASEGSRLEVASQLVRKCEKLLDIGCGEGLLAILAKGKYREFFGIDISQTALEMAKSRGIQTFCANIDAEPLPFPDDSFDCVVSLDVIEHVFAPLHLLSESKRVLVTGGNLIISTPNIRHWTHLRRLVVRGRFPKTSSDTQGFDGGHLHYFTYADVMELLRICGFTRLEKHATAGVNYLKEFRSPAIVIRAMA